MKTLREILTHQIADNERTRRYQGYMDAGTDQTLARIREDDSSLYAGGRRGQMPGTLAFCYYSPLSKHNKNAELLGYFSKSMDHFCDELLKDEFAGVDTWSFTWALEGFVYGYFWLEDDLNPALKQKALDASAKVADLFVYKRDMGQVGNQVMIGATGDLLLGHLLNRQEYIDIATERFNDTGPKTLWKSGQVVEQYGPCHHYSYTAFVHAFHYIFLADRKDYDETILNTLDWFRRSLTESMYQITGASSRIFAPMHTGGSPLFPGMEYAASYQPMYLKMMDRMCENQPDPTGAGYSCASAIWQVLINRNGTVEPTDEHIREWNKPSTRFYESVYYGRGPIKYGLIRRKYQTGMCFTGWLPLMGLQTWAWGDEPPIISLVHDVPSCTQAWGIDTARVSTSHLYHKHGPGCMAADVVWRGEGCSQKNLPDELPFVVWRHHTLRHVAIFTDVSTVLILSGPAGERITRWTLNPTEPAEPVFDQASVVSFKGRTARLYSLHEEPRLEDALDQDSGNTVQTLLYDVGARDTAFAFSNDSFEFLRDDLEEHGIMEFRDATGTYRADISTIATEHGLTCGADTAKVKSSPGAGPPESAIFRALSR